MKVDEAVFEALTQQYELAKVQEAKDTPTVKVLDTATVPEKRSFPPRLLIMFICTLLTVAGTALLTGVNDQWQNTDPKNPTKLFVREVMQTVNASMPWSSLNGSQLHQFTHRCWVRVVHHDRSSRQEKNS